MSDAPAIDSNRDAHLSGGGMRTYQDSGTYTENSTGQITQHTTHEWRHDLAR